MACCLSCCGRKTTDLPEKYTERRSCTDIVFAILFILFLGCFFAFGVIVFRGGNLKGFLRGSDYLGHYCGENEGPSDFASHIPLDAPFQSPTWSENKYVWYPLPLVKSVSTLLNVGDFIHLGVCVKTCPKTNVTALGALLKGNFSEAIMKSVTVYSYGNMAIDNVTVSAASHMYALYDTSLKFTRCLPSLRQPQEVKKSISSPITSQVYNFVVEGVIDVQNSWRVFVIEGVFAIILGCIFLFLLRLLISFIVWLMLIAFFVALVGAGAFCFVLYYTKGQTAYLMVAAAQHYSAFFLILSILLWIAAFVYLLVILALAKKIRFVCAVIKVAGRIMASAPTMVLLPLITTVLIAVTLVWAILIGVCLYSSSKKGIGYSLVPVTNALLYDGAQKLKINGTDMFNVSTAALTSPYASGYLALADVFGFFWTAGFLDAFCFTVIAFVAVFWYFSDLRDEAKAVPVYGIYKGVWWTLFYHMGTLALGSLLVAIVQTLRVLLTYFAKKARVLVTDNHLLRCLVCYAQCFLAYFERVLLAVNRNAYTMMCVTSENFCVSACRAIALMIKHAAELVFLDWFLGVVMFMGKLCIIGVCCLTAYFLLDVPALAPEVRTKVLPLIVVAVLVYFLGSVFFNVYMSAASALLVCYCYDRDVNSSRGTYYVPQELEHQIDDYSQKNKAALLYQQQAAAHKAST